MCPSNLFSIQANEYKDTLPKDVTNITYEPKLATFEMDIMQVKSLLQIG